MTKEDNQIYKKPQRYLGPSQFASALGLSIFQSPSELRDRIENGHWQTVNSNMSFGLNHEKIALEHYAEETGYQITTPKWKTHPENPRLGGIADGLVFDSETGELSHGVEIKCHPNRDVPLDCVPDYYLPQVAGYLAMYVERAGTTPLAWDFVSTCFNGTEEVSETAVTRVTWDEIKDQWENNWFPKLCEFTESIKWNY